MRSCDLDRDRADFPKLVETHERAIRAVLREWGLKGADVDDVCGDVVCDAWESFRRFDRSRSFRPWVLTITRRRAAAFLRRRRRNAEVLRTLHVAQPAARTDPDDAALTLRELTRYRERLTARQRDFLMLRFGDGRTPDEIARLRHTTAATVRAALSKAMARLRDAIPE